MFTNIDIQQLQCKSTYHTGFSKFNSEIDQSTISSRCRVCWYICVVNVYERCMFENTLPSICQCTLAVGLLCVYSVRSSAKPTAASVNMLFFYLFRILIYIYIYTRCLVYCHILRRKAISLRKKLFFSWFRWWCWRKERPLCSPNLYRHRQNHTWATSCHSSIHHSICDGGFWGFGVVSRTKYNRKTDNRSATSCVVVRYRHVGSSIKESQFKGNK